MLLRILLPMAFGKEPCFSFHFEEALHHRQRRGRPRQIGRGDRCQVWIAKERMRLERLEVTSRSFWKRNLKHPLHTRLNLIYSPRSMRGIRRARYRPRTRSVSPGSRPDAEP